MALNFLRFFGAASGASPEAAPVSKTPIFLYNTLSGKKEEFKPVRPGKVFMYNCGPTVYDNAHIGNLRAYVFADTLRKTLEYNGFEIKQIINITDVGHLTSDADEGEDKVEKRAREERKPAKEIIEAVTEKYFSDLRALNVPVERIIFPRASEHIGEQIAFVKTLEEKGYTYKTSDGVYFDTSLFPNYGKLGNINIKGQKEGARVEINKERKHPSDFALWKFSSPPDSGAPKREQEWPSPWGIGFPGWHIECSAMSMKYLGRQFDIHTGGIDHVPIHHNNEIAQTESVTGKPMANYWMHSAFITIENRKISKSLGNGIMIQNLLSRGVSALAYRYLLLGAHYRTGVNFTWEAAAGAEIALEKLRHHIVEELPTKPGKPNKEYLQKFRTFINDDLDTPKAVALMWELIKDTRVKNESKRATILEFDKVFGLKLGDLNQTIKEMRTVKIPHDKLPEPIKARVGDREKARQNKDFATADVIRKELEEKGYSLKDTPEGPEISLLRKDSGKLVR